MSKRMTMLDVLFGEDGANITSRTVELKPGEFRQVELGTYNSSIPEPLFDVEVTPEVRKKEVDVHIDRLTDDKYPGKTAIFSHVQNWSPEVCEVTLTRSTGKER